MDKKEKWALSQNDGAELFDCLSRLRPVVKCFDCYPDRKRGKKPFLLDYQWCKGGAGTVLAVESELSTREIRGFKHDFEKLLCWKSPLKLMIAWETPGLKAERISKELSEYASEGLSQFVKDEVFLLFVFGPKNQNHAYGYVAPGGDNTKFEFNKIPLPIT
jgi:hypothetical protein